MLFGRYVKLFYLLLYLLRKLQKLYSTVEIRKSAPANKACPPKGHTIFCFMKDFVIISILSIKQLHFKAQFRSSEAQL